MQIVCLKLLETPSILAVSHHFPNSKRPLRGGYAVFQASPNTSSVKDSHHPNCVYVNSLVVAEKMRLQLPSSSTNSPFVRWMVFAMCSTLWATWR